MRRIREYAGDAASNRFVLWAAFVVVHLYLGLINIYSPLNPIGDVRFVYSGWMDQAFAANYWVGIDAPWVYPIAALVPMVAAYLLSFGGYTASWLTLVLVVDAVALATLTGWGRRARNVRAGWYWVGFTVAVGPISSGRIDAISVALAIIGVVVLAAHPIAASVVIAFATWVKVWPVALIAALVIGSRHRAAVIASVLGTSVGIIAITLAFGSGWNVLSFITQQTGRGLQVEAPISTIWAWQGFAGVPNTTVYYDMTILTYQVTGNGVDVAAMVMNPILLIAVLAVAILGLVASRRRADAAVLLPLLSLAFITALIVFNKVGSPQYVTWLVVPVMLALVTGGRARRLFRAPAVLLLIIAVLTQLIYPFFYDDVILLHAPMLVILTIRNLLLIVLFAWAIAALARLRPGPDRLPS